MGMTVVIHDIRDFGEVGGLEHTRYGLALAQTIVNDYLLYQRPSGNPYCERPPCLSAYIATLMEGTEGFEQLTTQQVNTLLFDAMEFFRKFEECIDDMTRRCKRQVRVFPADLIQRRVALVI